MPRFAARDGFRAVEFMFPYEHDPKELAARLKAHGLQQVLFNAPPGDFEGGERGIAALPGREAEFRAGFEQALRYAEALQCPRIHVMAALVPEPGARARMRDTYLANLAWAAALAGAAGRHVLIEPINGRDMPGYFLSHQADAHAVIAEVGSPYLQVQMDLYHCQIVEGDLEARMRQYLPTGRVGHFQIAGIAARHEPDQGEVHFPHLFGVMDALGYDGWVGCEYRPAAGTSAGLGWLHALG